METPQVFRFPLLHAAYQKVLQNGTLVTDEVSAATLSDIPVWLVENLSPNLKITLPGDLESAAALLP
jgi:2-C-methyl-D-erythritol 4-phosphate cytidylyltransferase